jgi:hypothetical protein
MTAPSDASTLTIMLTPELSAALDRAIADAGVEQSRELIVVQVLREWAAAKGYAQSTEEGLRPDQLNAANDG